MRTRHRAPHTNGVVERWIETLKFEHLYRHDIASGVELADSVAEFIDEYNAVRPHQALDQKPPLTAYLRARTLKPNPPKTEQTLDPVHNGYRGAMSDLGDALAERETGLLITVDELQGGDVEEIREWRIGRMVFAPTWRTLSDVDRRLLLAMAQDDAESKLPDIADRLGATTSYAGVYRQRRLRAGMILPAG